MQKVIIVRGQNGVVAWNIRRTGVDQLSWICLRDNFAIKQPSNSAGIEGFLTQLSQHSGSLVGAISQVVELEI